MMFIEESLAGKIWKKYAIIVRYVISGGTAAGVDLAFIYLFTDIFHIYYLYSSVMAFVIAFVISFTLQKFWTFQDGSVERWEKQATIYFFVAVGNLALNTFYMYILVDYFGLWYLLSQVIAGLTVALSSFFIYRKFIFNGEAVAVQDDLLNERPKNSSIHLYLFILISVLILYAPFWISLNKEAGKQIIRGEDPNYVLPVNGTDSFEYAILGINLAERGIFSESSAPPFIKNTFRTPGYPVFLALWRKVFDSYALFPLLQMFLVAGTAILIREMGKKIGWPKAGLFAAYLYILDPNTIFHTLVVLSDISFVFFITLSLYILFFADFPSKWEKWRYLKETLGGLVLGFATLIRPISMFLIILLLPFYYFYWRREKSLKIILIGSLLIVLGYSVLILPWMARNKSVSGVFGISSLTAYNLIHYNLPEFLSWKNQTTPDMERLKLFSESGVPRNDMLSLERGAELNKVSFKYLKENFFSYSFYHAFKTIPFFLSSSLKNIFISINDLSGKEVWKINHGNLTNLLLKGDISGLFEELKIQPLVFLEQIFWLTAFLFALITLAFKKEKFYVLLFIGLVCYFAFLTGPISYARYRLPALPFFFLLFGIGFGAVANMIKIKIYEKKIRTIEE